MKSMTIKTWIAAIAVLALGSGVLQATTVDFESPESPSTYYFGTDGAATLTRSTEQAYGGTYSAKMQLSVATPGNDFAKINMPYTGALGDTTATAQVYVPSAQARPELSPYLYFIVDCNTNGVYDYPNDGLVIAFVSGGGTQPNDAWFQTSLDALTKVHVVGCRTGLGATEFSASNSPAMGTLGDLRSKTFSGGTTWGDLDIILARAGAGEWPGATSYTAYVDNFSVVPEPATMTLLALGGLGVLARRRRW